MNAALNSTTIPNQLLADWISQLSGDELKVMLYLTVRTGCFAGAADDVRLGQIAAGTNLSKKEVRSALRVLSINAEFHNRFGQRSYGANGVGKRSGSSQRHDA